MGALSAKLLARSKLCETDVVQMYSLYSRYYESVTLERFREDLADKRWVIQLTTNSQLCGFSTVTVDEFFAAGSTRRAIFSGDTIIDHRHWGEQILTEAFCRLAGTLKATEPETPLYWFLISKGYRTYRYLGLFARSYFPHPASATPPEIVACLDALARRRFGTAWQREQGLVRFGTSHGHLKPEWASVRSGLLRHNEVEYFLKRNPGYVHGDELACITELTSDNLRSRAARAFQEGFRGGASILSSDI